MSWQKRGVSGSKAKKLLSKAIGVLKSVMQLARPKSGGTILLSSFNQLLFTFSNFYMQLSTSCDNCLTSYLD